MEIGIKMHIETINQTKKFIKQKDYEGLKVYIENREVEVKNFIGENQSSDYIETLVKDLN